MRKNKPVKTKYSNIFEVQSANGSVQYLATWTQNGRRYAAKNLTNLYGSVTAKKASDELNKLRVSISQGHDPFAEETNTSLSSSFVELVHNEIQERDASGGYKYMLKMVFDKHLSSQLSKKKINEITAEMLYKIFRKVLNENNIDTVITLKKAISPSLKTAEEEGIIKRNPLESQKIKKLLRSQNNQNGKAPLSHRINGRGDDKYVKVVRMLYRAALTITPANVGKPRGTTPANELQLAFLFAIMTARRRKEILELRYEDLTKYNTAKPRPDTTKTNVYEEYPLPKEIMDRLETNGEGAIFKVLKKETYNTYYKAMVEQLDIPLHDDSKLTGHDTRNLFLTIMSKETKNPFLCDKAISHSEKGYAILERYYQPDIQDFQELFDQYWALIREEQEVNQSR